MTYQLAQIDIEKKYQDIFNNSDNENWSVNLISKVGLGTLLQLGISSIPGLKFFISFVYGDDEINQLIEINNNDKEKDKKVLMIGPTGIFQQNFTEYKIYSLRLDKISYDSLVKNGNGYCIIDLVGTTEVIDQDIKFTLDGGIVQ